jgi:ribA/ribD-fused uncharacterized protein
MSILFNSKSLEYNWLSNFYNAPMMIHGKEFQTVEHWFQSQKFLDFQVQENIRLASTPASARALGKKKHTSFRENWDSIRETIMLEGLRAKFQQHQDLKEKLLATKTLELQEQSPWDSYWGTGNSGNGKNRMGQLLMQLRKELS